MPSDISLAVGDGARRMTYAELAAARGISPASAKRLTQRHRWGRQIGNDGVVRVTVPLSALVNHTENQAKSDAPDNSLSSATATTDAATPTTVTSDIANDAIGDIIPATDVLARAVETLREQLANANYREEAERRRAERAEQQVDELREDLRRAAEERRMLLAMLTDQRARPWWRRWFR